MDTMYNKYYINLQKFAVQYRIYILRKVLNLYNFLIFKFFFF